MTEKLTPGEVARLDPFGVRKIPASEELEELLEETKPIEPEIPSSEIVIQEKNEWQKVLGVEVEIKPLPSFVTPEVKRNLEEMGFGLRFIPKVDIGTVDGLKKKGAEKYLDELQARYPGWKRYESLSDTERDDHSVGRNLEEWYWKQVKDGDIDFPRLPGVWVAVETMPKPSYGELYEKTPVSDKLGLSDRFNVTWSDAQAAIQKAKQGILSEAGLPSGLDMRMLEAHEWNLLANREGWGATKTYEWTNTEYRGAVASRRVVVGRSAGGAFAHPPASFGARGFRLAIVLDSRPNFQWSRSPSDFDSLLKEKGIINREDIFKKIEKKFEGF